MRIRVMAAAAALLGVSIMAGCDAVVSQACYDLMVDVQKKSLECFAQSKVCSKPSSNATRDACLCAEEGKAYAVIDGKDIECIPYHDGDYSDCLLEHLAYRDTKKDDYSEVLVECDCKAKQHKFYLKPEGVDHYVCFDDKEKGCYESSGKYGDYAECYCKTEVFKSTNYWNYRYYDKDSGMCSVFDSCAYYKPAYEAYLKYGMCDLDSGEFKFNED